MRAYLALPLALVMQPVTCPPFKAWEPGDNEVICAKPQMYYRDKCFDPKMREKESKIKSRFRGPKRLQVTCRNLMRTMGECLKWFNDLCSKDYLQTGEGDFTPATTSGMSRNALIDFKIDWDHNHASLNLFLCTAYAGQCEHPAQLQYCTAVSVKGPALLSLCVNAVILLIYNS